ncbi:hypothetical protein ACIBL8_48390 [Streptomyces sp. NPDC050523]|uniref:hypothetical protein n=1 Tax=Streptomyces sp. NPDC050523 TaxID=3365622 RepID=UPI0037BB6DB9
MLGAATLIALGTAPAAVAAHATSDLVVGDISPIKNIKPGSSFKAPVTVANKGPKAAKKVWVVYSITRGLGYTALPSNCVAQQVPFHDEVTAKRNAVCEFDQAVKPGVAYAPGRPLTIKALGRALNDVLRVSVRDVAPALDDAGTRPVRGTSPAVKLVERPAGGQGAKDAVDVPVTTVNTADFKVAGAHLKGRVGDTVTMKVTFTNAGPAWVLRRADTPRPTVLITPPTGTSIVGFNGDCESKGKTYTCGITQRWVNERDSETYTVDLKIDKQVPDAKGSITLDTAPRPFDPDKTNDKATITIDVTDGASPSASPSGSGGSTNGTGAPTAESSWTGGTYRPPTGGDGSLASTGSGATLPLAGTAVAAVAAGTGVVLLMRRRRAQNRA